MTATDVPAADDAWLAWAVADDERWWAVHGGVEHDPSGLHVEQNVLRYRPVPHLVLRVGEGARDREVARIRSAARTAGVPLTESRHGEEDDAAFAPAEGAVYDLRKPNAPGADLLRELAEFCSLDADTDVLDGPSIDRDDWAELVTEVRTCLQPQD